MNKLTLKTKTQAILLTIAMAAVAYVPSAKADALCDGLGSAASAIMEARQNNVPMSKLMLIANKGESEQAKDLFKAMVVDAYGQQRWSSDTMKASAVEDFGNDVMVECYKKLR